MPAGAIAPGTGAGQLNHPRGVAADPNSGHIFIAELNNDRISEYTAWGEFIKAWGWGVADGSAALQTCGPSEPQEDPDPALCSQGVVGAGKGQLNDPFGVAVDPAGNVYVYEFGNRRVQKFSPSGNFILMFGGDVNKTKADAAAPPAQRNVCPFDTGDVCQAGISGEGASQLSSTLGDFIDYSPIEGGRILVGDKAGFQVFDLEGNHVKTIPFSGALASFATNSVNGLDVHTDANVYFTLDGVPDVYKIDSTGTPLAPGKPGESKFDVGKPLGVAVDSETNVYTVEIKGLTVIGRYALGYDASGAPISGMESADEFAAGGDDLTALATNICEESKGPNLYLSHHRLTSPPRSLVETYGAPPIGCEDPPKRPPEILEQLAISAGRSEAVVKAIINPKFWPDTTYFVEYGPGKCAEDECDRVAPLSPNLLTEDSVNKGLPTLGVVLDGLQPDTVYHFRFVAEGGGGGPVFGVDPDGKEEAQAASFEEGLEGAFRTFRAEGTLPPCSNDAMRAGRSAELPDCRAYELVSPLDKGNSDVALWITRNAVRARVLEIDQGAPSGDRFTFTAATAFGEAESAPFVSQYLADREADGWTSEPISPPRTEVPVPATSTFGNDIRGLTEDLCHAGVRHFSVAPLADDAVEKYTNLYRRDNCAKSPSYEAITTVQPPHRSADEYDNLDLKGFSDDGSHTIFTTDDQLHADAPTPAVEELLLFEHTNGELRFVCYLPNGEPSPEACSTGTLMGIGDADISSMHNAVSADASHIFWTASSGVKRSRASHPGPIYVRIDGTETKEVSTTVADDPAFFWTAAEDGSRAIFSFDTGLHEDELYEVDVDTETPTLIAGEVEGPMGASEDASRIYFASKEDLDDTGPAVAGDHNLYLYEADPGGGGGDFTFVMELGTGDIGSDQPGLGNDPVVPIAFSPVTRGAAVNSDGLHAAFMSAASPTPTDYDNRDAVSGQPARQVYLYDAAEEELRCVSCNPTGIRPTGEEGAAARIQGWEALHHAPRVLSDDGKRVFFESFEALVPRDTNSTWDVYQWEEEGKGSCKATSETFSEDSGGCVDLISSGLSSRVSVFFDADPSGSNIFFGTLSSLVGPDYGLNDVYVARVGGGFGEPSEEEECEGEACQSPPPPPPELTPSSELSSGAGNEPATKPRKARRCPKGKRRVKRAGKVRCVKRKARANKSRRAGR